MLFLLDCSQKYLSFLFIFYSFTVESDLELIVDTFSHISDILLQFIISVSLFLELIFKSIDFVIILLHP